VETMEEFKEFLNSEYELSPVLDNYYNEGTAFDNWIIGFINGEGCFNLHNRGHLVFYIEHTDKNSLDLIKKRLDLGPNVLDRGNRNDTRQNTYSLSISSKKDLLSLRELLENPLLNRLEGYKQQLSLRSNKAYALFGPRELLQLPGPGRSIVRWSDLWPAAVSTV
jgi:hypothetical protein